MRDQLQWQMTQAETEEDLEEEIELALQEPGNGDLGRIGMTPAKDSYKSHLLGCIDSSFFRNLLDLCFQA